MYLELVPLHVGETHLRLQCQCEGVKGACKEEEGLVEGKALDVSTQRSLLLH